MNPELSTKLTPDTARALTDEVRADAAALWAKLLRLYEGGAHVALGYSSWAEYCAAEFDMGKSRAYQMLAAARVVEALPESTNVERPASEGVARELVPVLRDDPDHVDEVWAGVVQEHGPQPTASQVREFVETREAAFDAELVAHQRPAVEAPDVRADYPYGTAPELLRAPWPPEDGDGYCSPSPAEEAILYVLRNTDYYGFWGEADQVAAVLETAGDALDSEPSCADLLREIRSLNGEAKKFKEHGERLRGALGDLALRLVGKFDERRRDELRLDVPALADLLERDRGAS